MASVASEGGQSSQKWASSLCLCLLMKHLLGGLRKQPGGMGGGQLCPFSRTLRPSESMAALCAQRPLSPSSSQDKPEPPAQHPGGTPHGPALSPSLCTGGRAGGGPAHRPRLAAWHANGRGAETECALGQVQAPTEAGQGQAGCRAGAARAPPALDTWKAPLPLPSDRLLEVISSSSPCSGNRGKKTEAQQGVNGNGHLVAGLGLRPESQHGITRVCPLVRRSCSGVRPLGVQS